MYPEDRVLIAYVPEPADFVRIREERWYRIPVANCPKGIYAEYIAFYFGRKFGDLKWGIHYYARNNGHELVKRIDLFPDQGDHKRAQDLYFKIQLGSIQARGEPIVSLSWRRLLFLHTTWDRFCLAQEVQDLLIEGDGLSSRRLTLKEGEQSSHI
ncbi:MAG: hypothetical protein QNJ45_03580 [Ardenticatenaceae bacterium]|nr:hypothetical protein [Ardenticatenaceae bacterium]